VLPPTYCIELKPNHVSLSIEDKGDESVLTDRRFLFLNASTVLDSADASTPQSAQEK